MITAKEAYEYSQKNSNKKELEYIERLIEDAILNGETCCVFEISHKKTIKELKELGYNVLKRSYSDKYNISWGLEIL